MLFCLKVIKPLQAQAFFTDQKHHDHNLGIQIFSSVLASEFSFRAKTNK